MSRCSRCGSWGACLLIECESRLDIGRDGSLAQRLARVVALDGGRVLVARGQVGSEHDEVDAAA